MTRVQPKMPFEQGTLDDITTRLTADNGLWRIEKVGNETKVKKRNK